MKHKLLTLCLIVRDTEILLGRKKRGFGEGNWNGFGGKVEVSETIFEGAKRELREESGLELNIAEQRGMLHFDFANDPSVLEVHVFNIAKWSGQPQETEEMEPKWFPLNAIPFQDMWADDSHWFPLFLAGKYFTGTFHFSDFETIADFELRSFDKAPDWT